MVGRFLDCGLLEDGFARVRCAACRAEFLVAFRCKGRGFSASCQARRLAEWNLWLDEHLLAPVAHRHVVLTIPERLRACFLYDRRRLGLLSRVAYRTLHGYVCAALGASDAVLSLLVREGWLEQDAAASMLAWPHSGFSAYVGPAIAAETRAAVASDASEGPYAGVHRFTAVEFLARPGRSALRACRCDAWPRLRLRAASR